MKLRNPNREAWDNLTLYAEAAEYDSARYADTGSRDRLAFPRAHRPHLDGTIIVPLEYSPLQEGGILPLGDTMEAVGVIATALAESTDGPGITRGAVAVLEQRALDRPAIGLLTSRSIGGLGPVNELEITVAQVTPGDVDTNFELRCSDKKTQAYGVEQVGVLAVSRGWYVNEATSEVRESLGVVAHGLRRAFNRLESANYPRVEVYHGSWW